MGDYWAAAHAAPAPGGTEGLVYFGGGIPPPPDVSMANALTIALAQEAAMGADLANYQ